MCPQKFLQSARMNHCAACLRFLALVVTCSGARQAPCAVVANYSDRTVRLIVTFSAGNMTDIIARSIGLQGGVAEIGRASRGRLLLTSACSPARTSADGVRPTELDPSPPSMGRTSSARSALALPFPLPRHRDAARCHPA